MGYVGVLLDKQRKKGFNIVTFVILFIFDLVFVDCRVSHHSLSHRYAAIPLLLYPSQTHRQLRASQFGKCFANVVLARMF